MLHTQSGAWQEATRTHKWTHTCTHAHAGLPPHSHFHINVSFPLLLPHTFLLVSAAHITWASWSSTKRAAESRLLPYCMPTSMHTFNNRPCHWNKSQSSSVSGPSDALSNFISPEQKIGAREINLWSIPNILPTVQAAPGGGGSIYQWGRGDNLFEMYCITAQRITKLAREHGDENKSNRTPQFHGDAPRRNEMTVRLPSCHHAESSGWFSVCKDTHVKQLCPSHYEAWTVLLLDRSFLFTSHSAL